jgi:hypothetical protein
VKLIAFQEISGWHIQNSSSRLEAVVVSVWSRGSGDSLAKVYMLRSGRQIVELVLPVQPPKTNSKQNHCTAQHSTAPKTSSDILRTPSHSIALLLTGLAAVVNAGKILFALQKHQSILSEKFQ